MRTVPTKPEGVYQDSRGGWYFKVSLGTDPLTGRREQITRRGFASASAAGRARREVLGRKDSGLVRPAPKLLTVNELLDLYLDGLDADGSLGAKTRFDYRSHADAYVRPWLGARRVRDVSPDGDPDLATKADRPAAAPRAESRCRRTRSDWPGRLWPARSSWLRPAASWRCRR